MVASLPHGRQLAAAFGALGGRGRSHSESPCGTPQNCPRLSTGWSCTWWQGSKGDHTHTHTHTHTHARTHARTASSSRRGHCPVGRKQQIPKIARQSTYRGSVTWAPLTKPVCSTRSWADTRGPRHPGPSNTLLEYTNRQQQQPQQQPQRAEFQK